LLPSVLTDCNTLLLSGFIFQQDGALPHTARLMHAAVDCIAANCFVIISRDAWPPNSPD